jgi:protein-arginine kinase activator protein McsA
MIDKLFEQFDEFMSSLDKSMQNFDFNTKSDLPWHYYVVTTTTINGETTKNVKTNIPSLKTESEKKYLSEKTQLLEKEIKEKRAEMKKMAQAEKFEEAIELKTQIADLENKLSESKESDRMEFEKNKTARERLGDLQSKLALAVQKEDYELAAQIRDQIKSLPQ